MARRRVVPRFAVVVVVALLVPLGLMAVVALARSGPLSIRVYVGYAPWFSLGALVVVGLTVVLIGDQRTVIRGVLAMMSFVVLLAHAYVAAGIVGTGWSRGVAVNPFVTTQPTEAEDEPDFVFRYSEHAGQPLDLFVWAPPPSDTPAPILLYVHGGGWTAGEPRGRAAQLRWFADRGWLVLAPEYPLSGPSRHLWDAVEPQVGCAMVWAARQAPSLGGDRSRLVLAGDSAGANIALVAAYRAATSDLASACGGEPGRAAAVVGLYALVDPVGFHGVGGALGPEARRMAEEYVGGPPWVFPQRYRAISPVTHLSQQAPPTLLLVAGDDQLIPEEGAEHLRDAASAAGATVSIVELPHLDHGFDAAPLPDALYREITHRWLAAGHPLGSNAGAAPRGPPLKGSILAPRHAGRTPTV